MMYQRTWTPCALTDYCWIEMAESSRTTSLEHQMNSMMAEIVKLQRDVVDLNKEIGKTSINGSQLLSKSRKEMIWKFVDITVYLHFPIFVWNKILHTCNYVWTSVHGYIGPWGVTGFDHVTKKFSYPSLGSLCTAIFFIFKEFIPVVFDITSYM